LYNPKAEPTVFEYKEDGVASGNSSFIFDEKIYPYGLFIKEGYEVYNTAINKKERRELWKLMPTF